MRSSILILTLSLAIGALAAAPDRNEERIWTGTNGSSFRGMYIESIGQRSTSSAASPAITRLDLSRLPG